MRPIAFLTTLRRQGGVSIITAVFLLLLLATLSALIANVISAAHTTSAEDVLGARAYQAARAEVEFGLYRVLESAAAGEEDTVPAEVTVGTACTNPVKLNKCPSVAPTNIDGFAVSLVCTPLPGSGPAGYFDEGCRRIRIYRLVGTASIPGPNGLTVEREVQVTAERCQDASKVPSDC